MNVIMTEANNTLTKLKEEHRHLDAEITELEDKLANEYYSSDEPPKKLNKKASAVLDSTYVTSYTYANPMPSYNFV